MNFVPEVFSYLLTASLSLPEDIGVLWAGENDGTEVAAQSPVGMSFLMAACSTGESCLFADGYSFDLLPTRSYSLPLTCNQIPLPAWHCSG